MVKATRASDPPAEELLDWLAEMIVIRKFEVAADALTLRGKIPGGVHPAIGQEAVAVGVMRALEREDVIAGTHRSHHHALAKGLSPQRVMAELFGMSTGVAGGRGGSMHLADFDLGLWGSNGIVGGGLGIALGAALGAKQLGLSRVSVGFFGDGGANTGRVWEFINLASVWTLPLIAICENNLYAVETTSSAVTGGKSVTERALAFGLPAEQVDGQDVVAVFEATSRAVARAREGKGASFLELLTYRYTGHNSGESTPYRSDDELELWRSSKDPIEQLSNRLVASSDLTGEALASLNDRADAIVAEAIEFAEESQCSDPSTAGENVSAWNNWNGSIR
jgi:TPP-dependent pyruvate/acetoin dehydrogenase alpha subunit